MKYKRSLALLLAVILSLGSVMASLAAGVLDDAPPGGKPGQGKAEWNTISENYGYRLSMTSVYPYWEEGYVPSINNYPEINFDTFMSEVNTLVTENYLESGNTGMYYISEPNGFKAVDNDLKLRHTQLTKLRNNPGPRDNPLAQWYMANQDLATKMTCDGTWKTIPDVAGVSGAQCVDLISQMVGSGVSNNFKEFSMSVGSTHNPDNNVDIDYIGYSMALIALWKAAESTDAAVAADMENLLNQYFKTDSKGDTAKNFPIITVESVVGVVNYNGDSFWLTLPQLVAVSSGQGGTISAERMWHFNKEGVDAGASSLNMINHIFNSNAAAGVMMSQANSKTAEWAKFFGQGINCTYVAGAGMVGAVDTDRAGRRHLETVYIGSDRHEGMAGIGAIYGMCVYGARPPSTEGDSGKYSGTFTWDLNPKGAKMMGDPLNDTSSTITKLNVSQDGFNNNNYQEWNNKIINDSSDCNTVNITVYRKDDVAAPSADGSYKPKEYFENQVKSQGVNASQGTDHFTALSGTVGNSVTGVSFASGQDTTITDAQLLDFLKKDTGLTFAELAHSPLPLQGTYEITIFVDVGCSGKKYELGNAQTEYVLYYPDDGRYSWQSDIPSNGYSEIKCGYFKPETEYAEPYEAMAGLPTTENLYFTSGGQEFVAEIEYQYTVDKTAIRTFEQRYSPIECAGWYNVDSYNTWTDALSDTISSWSGWSQKVENKNYRKCAICGREHFAGAEPMETAYVTSQTGTGQGKITFGPGLWNTQFTEVRWDWSVAPIGKHCTEGCVETETGTSHSDCNGMTGPDVLDSATQPPSITCGHETSEYTKKKVTRWTGKAFAQHKDINTGAGTQSITASLKFEQDVRALNYAKIKKCNVWKISESKLEGGKVVTIDGDDVFQAEVDAIAPDVIFNVAEDDTAKSGRLYYSLHPGDLDDFKFTQTLPTRGCCSCYNYNAAEDSIASTENPNLMYEQIYNISDYCILEQTKGDLSLLYYEYHNDNATVDRVPLATFRPKGVAKDNTYEVMLTDGTWHSPGDNPWQDRNWSVMGQPWKSHTISFDNVNPTRGDQISVCENSNSVGHDNIDEGAPVWGGYNGRYSAVEAGVTDEVQPKYDGITAGHKKKNITLSPSKQHCLATDYAHNNEGEVNGFSTDSPQTNRDVTSTLYLTHNDIDVHDIECHNGEKKFGDSNIFYWNVINYPNGNQAMAETGNDAIFNKNGFSVETWYSNAKQKINRVIIHNPVSSQFALLEKLPDELDQRTEGNMTAAKNTDDGKCPLVSNKCPYSHISCKWDGNQFHDDKCYAVVRGDGLADIPVTGSTSTILKPVETWSKSTGENQFAYTGAVQTFTAPATGDYVLEVWGAAGGASEHSQGTPGAGGYSKGTIALTAGEAVQVYVGGAGEYGGGPGWNGGGSGYANKSSDSGGGGGATDMRRSGARIIVAGGGGGNGCSNCMGGSGGGSTGQAAYGSNAYGGGGGGGTQSANGYANGSITWAGTGSGASASGGYGCGGGGGGYFGGGTTNQSGGGNGGGGGSGYVDGLRSTVNQTGGNAGNGRARISWAIDVKTIIYVPEVSGSHTVDTTQATIIECNTKPVVYTAPSTGTYSLHAFGASGGGDQNQGAGSHAGLGGYSAGTVFLTKGQSILVYPGGQGVISSAGGPLVYEWYLIEGCGTGLGGSYIWSATRPPNNCSHQFEKTGRTRGGAAGGGYNGGGNSGTTTGFGGGGSSDVLKSWQSKLGKDVATHTPNLITKSGNSMIVHNSGSVFPSFVNAKAGRIYRFDYVGTGFDKAASWDSYTYCTNGQSGQNVNARIVNQRITSTSAQIFIQLDADATSLEARMFNSASGDIRIDEVFMSDMTERILTAGGGGGSDDAGGALGSANDGSGGGGGGLEGGNPRRDGILISGVAGTQSSGYLQGVGQSNTVSDGGGAGAGWWGGRITSEPTNNAGGSGGSSNYRGVQNGITKAGQNLGNGYVAIVLPGKGQTKDVHSLSCSEPHHAPSLWWKRYTDGWMHQGAIRCTGVTCTECTVGTPLMSPSGYQFNPGSSGNMWVVSHDGVTHLTDNSDTFCDTCGEVVVVDKYTTDRTNYKNCMWKATDYDTQAFDTKTAINPAYHYTFGDAMCYNPCTDDEKHKIIPATDQPSNPASKAGSFVILDKDIKVYFPNIGDFYGDGAFGVGQTQDPEGYGYVDQMDTTIWLKEKYITFPFNVNYLGHTYTVGEHVPLGWYDEGTYTWHDDKPGDYWYTMHVELASNELASGQIDFYAIAKNSPYDEFKENKVENRNYTRYNRYAYHDSDKPYKVDVLGRIGVLNIIDTGDFRFSNFFKQTLDGYLIDSIVKEVDVSKQNNVLVHDTTILGDPVSVTTHGQNTYGNLPWLEPVDKLYNFPLVPARNNIKSLRKQAHRVGYKEYMSLMTIGNYYGENHGSHIPDHEKVQVRPTYYHLDLGTGVWTPVDVYINLGDKYSRINIFDGNDKTVAEYNFYYDLNWSMENERRMYTEAERSVTEGIHEGRWLGDDEDVPAIKTPIPSGTSYLHGTAQMLHLMDGNRTFIGSSVTEGHDWDTDDKLLESSFNLQGQRWNFTLGLPSTATFVERNTQCTEENSKKLSQDNGVIVCALDIIVQGEVWRLRYSGTPLGEQQIKIFENGKTYNYANNPNGPGDKQVVVVYSNDASSRNDLGTEGTH